MGEVGSKVNVAGMGMVSVAGLEFSGDAAQAID